MDRWVCWEYLQNKSISSICLPLTHYLKKKLRWAQQTRRLWAAEPHLTDVYCKPRRLLVAIFKLGEKLRKIDSASRSFLAILTRSAVSVVIFNDLLVINENKNVNSHALKLVWLERIDDDSSVTAKILTPEVDYELVFVDDEAWREFQTACGAWRDTIEASPNLETAKRRKAEHFFSPYCRSVGLGGAHYDGEWKMGRLHGRGTLTLANGKITKGWFRNDVAHGFCIVMQPKSVPSNNVFSVFYYQTPSADESINYDVFRGVFENGELNSLTQIRYAGERERQSGP
ncbi:unnamed protein product [Caenorhabditis auriculariae]|uniref:Uncharacterized protein n=1 Tax=Caenorhabditis auriculariae TaxID=2777116 RepID=A0A8S1H077_9PELO|nr:unnamed protein product [Caenorhabditis auriculariae]